MCGIIGYVGDRTNAAATVLKGLKKLEYRGYDSWGVAVRENSGLIKMSKRPGKIGELKIGEMRLPKGTVAMAHSRWATHGGVNKKNAHPHGSCNGEIALIHNGIIENFSELKKKLAKKGHEFKSETDTEVIAHLIEDKLKRMRPGTNEKEARENFLKAVQKSLSEIKGRYALLIMSQTSRTILAARRGSPLIVGKGKNEHEYFVASDIPAFLEYTNEVMYLDDDEMVILDGGAHFYNLNSGAEVKKRIVKITWKAQEAEKGDFPHFMIKEITEQKETIHRAINQDPKRLQRAAEMIQSAFGTYFIGCGTAAKVCMVGEYMFSKVAQMHVNFSFGSEFPNFQHFIKNKSLLVAVSQSGETADTLEALEAGKKKGAKIMSIVNVEGSTMDRISDLSLYLNAGPEKAVASTKATTAQIAILTLLAYARAGKLDEGRKMLIEAGSKINDMLNPRYEDYIIKLARKIKNVESMYVIGRGLNYPIALESAIKLQEVSYIHAEGFAGGELKHGPIALISKKTPVIAFVPNDET
ncbi:glutamine--fructose-6-phosphate transaminase (isomerizing), partial [Candidatus Peregrinibacteria bacterium CG11_big_fil_rev_8_21_14_0_20_46_8]